MKCEKCGTDITDYEAELDEEHNWCIGCHNEDLDRLMDEVDESLKL